VMEMGVVLAKAKLVTAFIESVQEYARENIDEIDGWELAPGRVNNYTLKATPLSLINRLKKLGLANAKKLAYKEPVLRSVTDLVKLVNESRKNKPKIKKDELMDFYKPVFGKDRLVPTGKSSVAEGSDEIKALIG